MKVNEALGILKPSEPTKSALIHAYREACKRFHPDVNPDGLEMMKLINLAYETLKANIGQWGRGDVSSMSSLADDMQEIFNKIRHLPDIHIEVCGTWMWVTGKTKPVKQQLKEAGLRFAWKKQAWYWRPNGYRKFSRREWELDEIRQTWGSDNLDTEPHQRINVYA